MAWNSHHIFVGVDPGPIRS
uniref:Uncharacterized protein n=1 Tax=Anguilla anguilla TaxID=7936 RepID=A0A0E9TI62_ANGAN